MKVDLIIDSLYEEGTPLRRILLVHSKAVADKAVAIAQRHSSLFTHHSSLVFIHDAVMLHDIGIIFCDAPGIECHGTEPYICHGLLGAKYLREHCGEWGMTTEEIEPYARVCERHTGAGLSSVEIKRQGLPLPEQDFLPETMEEKLICYADKFYSKTHLEGEKEYEKVLRSMQKFGPETVERFLELRKLFE